MKQNKKNMRLTLTKCSLRLKKKEKKKKKKTIKQITHCPASELIEFNMKMSTRDQLFSAFYFSLMDIMSAF